MLKQIALAFAASATALVALPAEAEARHRHHNRSRFVVHIGTAPAYYGYGGYYDPYYARRYPVRRYSRG